MRGIPFGRPKRRTVPVFRFQFTWTGVFLKGLPGRKGVTLFVWAAGPTAEDARAAALRWSREELGSRVTIPPLDEPEIESLGQRDKAPDLKITAPGLWRTGFAFFPAPEPPN